MQAGSARARGALLRALGVLSAGVLGWVACSGAAPNVRDPRAGLQRDAQGRAFYEVRRFSSTGCNDARAGAREEEVRAQLSRQAQEQGYSGVGEVRCTNSGSGSCGSGTTCSGLALRYVSGSNTTNEVGPGHPCNPPCAANASCQEGVCVASCDPPCGADLLCGPGGRCEPAPRPPADGGDGGDASAR